MSEYTAARARITGDSWVDDLARASVTAAEAKFGPVRPAGPLSQPHHVRDCYGSRLHCISCGIDEPDQPRYRACLECRHVWATPGALLDAHNEVGTRCGETMLTDAAQVFSCPLCVHDF